MTRKLSLFLLIAVLLVAAPIAVMLALPPWHNKTSLRFHRWLHKISGIQIHYLNDYTGVVREWDQDGRLIVEYELVDGKRHGPWTQYREDGSIQFQSEYRAGKPWDGVCYIYYLKAWVGEYKNGKPWNGCLPSTETGKNEWVCIIDGTPVSEQEYKRRLDIPADAHLIGLHYTMPPSMTDDVTQTTE